VSGIVGMFHRDLAPVNASLLRALADSQAFPGSPATQFHVQGPIGFAAAPLAGASHRQSCAAQRPLVVGESLFLIADARLDDRAGLIRQLRAAGAAVGDLASDSQLILRSYRIWAEDCLDYLRGDFAFAFWDGRANKLFCARDHFGIKPFYYAKERDLFLFSSALHSVRAHPAISAELNENAIADFLLFGLNFDQFTTSFRDIYRLPPAHCLTISAGTLQLRRYWTPPTKGETRYRRNAEYIEHFQDLLRCAVADRLPADDVGVLLSGGMDSTSLAAVATDISRLGGSPAVHTYTALYASQPADREGEFAGQTAKFLNVPNRRIAMDQLRPFAWPGNSHAHHPLPDPPDNPYFGALALQFEAIAQECRVVLSGEGNDNLMYFQMWPYLQELRRKREWLRALQEVPRYLWTRPLPWRGIRARFRTFSGEDCSSQGIPSWIAPDFAIRTHLTQRWRACRELQMPMAMHPVRPKAHASLGLPHWATLFENESPGVTRYPVQVRYPFLDLRIVEYLLALPPFPWFFQKSLLRKSMAGKLPEVVRTRPKTPFRADPLRAILRRNTLTPPLDLLSHAGLDRFINCQSLPHLHATMGHEQLLSVTRPYCLGFWLQSLQLSGSELSPSVACGDR
jgi:asparagine synthase (glutamine-hydrolysing)